MSSQQRPAEAAVDAKSAVRVPVEAKFTFVVDDFAGFIQENSGNVSTGGMFIRTRTPKPAGTKIEFEFRLADDYPLIHGAAVVVWVREADEGPDRPSGMGIRYTWLDEKSRELVQTIVDNHARRGGAPYRHDRPDAAATAPSSAPAAPVTPPAAPAPPPAPAAANPSPAPSSPVTPPAVPSPPVASPPVAQQPPVAQPPVAPPPTASSPAVQPPPAAPPSPPPPPPAPVGGSPAASSPPPGATPAPPTPKTEVTDWHKELESGDFEINFDIVEDEPKSDSGSSEKAAAASPESAPAPPAVSSSASSPTPALGDSAAATQESGSLPLAAPDLTGSPMPAQEAGSPLAAAPSLEATGAGSGSPLVPESDSSGGFTAMPPAEPPAKEPKAKLPASEPPRDKSRRPTGLPVDDEISFSAPPSLPMPSPPLATEVAKSPDSGVSGQVLVPAPTATKVKAPAASPEKKVARGAKVPTEAKSAKRRNRGPLLVVAAAVVLLVAGVVIFGGRYLGLESLLQRGETVADASSLPPASSALPAATDPAASDVPPLAGGEVDAESVATDTGRAEEEPDVAPAPRRPERQSRLPPPATSPAARATTPPATPEPRAEPPERAPSVAEDRVSAVPPSSARPEATPPEVSAAQPENEADAESGAEVGGRRTVSEPEPSGRASEASLPASESPADSAPDSPPDSPLGADAEPPATRAPQRSPSTPPAAQQPPSARRAAATPPPPVAPPPVERGELVAIGPGVTLPAVRRRVDPRYPERARKARREADVELSLLIDENGEVVDVQTRGGKKDAWGFDQAAIDAARRTRFSPATKDGVEVKVWFPYRIVFRLR